MRDRARDEIVKHRNHYSRDSETELWREIGTASGRSLSFYDSESELHPLNAPELMGASAELQREALELIKKKIEPEMVTRLEPRLQEIREKLALAAKAATGASLLIENAQVEHARALGLPEAKE